MQNMREAMYRVAGLVLVLGGLVVTVFGQSSGDALENGFKTPPNSAKPRVWWHWMNGNITKEGIQLDLEWMKRVGIGGFQNFDASLGTPKLVDKRLVYMTTDMERCVPVYHQACRPTQVSEEAIAGSPGWSESGGSLG